MDHEVPSSAPGAAPGSHRVASLDVLRGVVMLLMALDHVRVYSGVPAGGPTWGVFLTRWVTHFCAPVFVFLAGTAAYLHGRRLADRAALARYLVSRGLLLVLLELTLVRLTWTFNAEVGQLLAGVIWVIGWCLALLALAVRLPQAAIGAIGVAIVVGHNAVDRWLPALGPAAYASRWSGLWQVLYLGGPIELAKDGPQLFVLYSIVPWIGVMLAGYAFGSVIELDPARRRRICLRLGGAMIGAFLVLRGLDAYGDPRPWRVGPAAAASRAGAPAKQPPPAALRFLGTTKYPASLLFLLMTLGPAVAAIPLLEKASASNAAARQLAVVGRVPLFYYVLHIPLIHAAACLVSLVRSGHVDPWLFANHPAMSPPSPDGYRWSLGLLYGVTFVVIALLIPLCRWRAGAAEERHRSRTSSPVASRT